MAMTFLSLVLVDPETGTLRAHKLEGRGLQTKSQAVVGRVRKNNGTRTVGKRRVSGLRWQTLTMVQVCFQKKKSILAQEDLEVQMEDLKCQVEMYTGTNHAGHLQSVAEHATKRMLFWCKNRLHEKDFEAVF